ncbi:endonuclease/exonuclease/phosphatase [Spirillospora sp. NPDC127200]
MPVRAVLAGALAALPLTAVPVAAAQAAPAPGGVPSPLIRDIQGAAHLSPLNGRDVARVPGVVTALSGNGFWMQDPRPDENDATSEGVFVFTRAKPAVAVGDAVRVDGRISEFRPGGAASAGLTRTEIDATATAVEARGVPLPPPAVLGPKGRRAPDSTVNADKGPLNVEAKGAFDPERDALDFYESLEGMRVRVEDAVAVGPSRAGEVPVLPAGGAGAGVRTKRGGILLRADDPNPERVTLDDALVPLPAMNVGDRLPGAADGVLDYGYGDFKLLLTATPARSGGGLAREETRAPGPAELTVATAGLDGLSPDTPAERFRHLATDIVTGLKSPDLITVTGLLDNSGTDDDGTVAADQTVAELITAISAVGGPAYDWRSVVPRDNSDGGEPGGNNRVGFLFRADRGLDFVDRPAGTASGGAEHDDPSSEPARPDTAVRVLGDGPGKVRLSLSPGRIEPADAAWSGTRKPVAGEVTWQGRRIIVVANHWFPRTGDDQPVYGRNQPPVRPSEWRRDAQARVVAGFVKSVRSVAKDADVIVAGDLNEREFATPVKTLAREAGLKEVSGRLPGTDRYTTVSGGNSEMSDHILLSPSLAKRKHEYDIVHRNAEFADRAGDHDPTLVRIDMSKK